MAERVRPHDCCLSRLARDWHQVASPVSPPAESRQRCGGWRKSHYLAPAPQAPRNLSAVRQVARAGADTHRPDRCMIAFRKTEILLAKLRSQLKLTAVHAILELRTPAKTRWQVSVPFNAGKILTSIASTCCDQANARATGCEGLSSHCGGLPNMRPPSRGGMTERRVCDELGERRYPLLQVRPLPA